VGDGAVIYRSKRGFFTEIVKHTSIDEEATSGGLVPEYREEGDLLSEGEKREKVSRGRPQ